MKTIVIARSKKLLAYLILIHSLLLVTLLSLLGTSWWSLFSTVLLIASFIYYARQHQWLKAKRSLVSVKCNDDKCWLLSYSDESQKSGLNLASSFVTPQLVMLYFKGRYFWQRRSVTVMPDAVDAELFWQLRVYLRTSKTFQQ
jgi:hypothetical protein